MNRILFLLACLFPAFALGQGSLGDYSKNLKIASSTATQVTVGTTGTAIVITGNSIALGTAAVTATGTISGITLSSLTLASGTTTNAGIISGGTGAFTQLRILGTTAIPSGSFGIANNGSLTLDFFLNGNSAMALYSNEMMLPANNSFGWSSSNMGAGFITGARDTYMSRQSAGVMRIGTTQTGSQGSISLGSLVSGIGISSQGTAGLTLGTASPVITNAAVLTSSSAMTIPLNQSPLVLGTAAATTTFSASGYIGTGTSGNTTKVIIQGGTAGSTVTWPGGWSSMAYGTSLPTTLNAGQKIMLDVLSTSTGTGGLNITFGVTP